MHAAFKHSCSARSVGEDAEEAEYRMLMESGDLLQLLDNQDLTIRWNRKLEEEAAQRAAYEAMKPALTEDSPSRPPPHLAKHKVQK